MRMMVLVMAVLFSVAVTAQGPAVEKEKVTATFKGVQSQFVFDNAVRAALKRGYRFRSLNEIQRIFSVPATYGDHSEAIDLAVTVTGTDDVVLVVDCIPPVTLERKQLGSWYTLRHKNILRFCNSFLDEVRSQLRKPTVAKTGIDYALIHATRMIDAVKPKRSL